MKSNLLLFIIVLNAYIIRANAQNLNNTFFNELFHYRFSGAESELLKIKDIDNTYKFLLMKSFLFMHKHQSGIKEYSDCGNISVNYSKEVRTKLKNKTLNDQQLFYYISASGILIKYGIDEKEYWAVASNLYSISTEIKYVTENEYKNEKFQLISGLYHYYAELATEDYPVMRSVFLFLPKGNKKHGIKLLKSCSLSNNLFISAYSLYYLARIYHRDEKIFYKSFFFYRKLLKLYPENLYWGSEYRSMVKFFKKK